LQFRVVLSIADRLAHHSVRAIGPVPTRQPSGRSVLILRKLTSSISPILTFSSLYFVRYFASSVARPSAPHTNQLGSRKGEVQLERGGQGELTVNGWERSSSSRFRWWHTRLVGWPFRAWPSWAAGGLGRDRSASGRMDDRPSPWALAFPAHRQGLEPAPHLDLLSPPLASSSRCSNSSRVLHPFCCQSKSLTYTKSRSAFLNGLPSRSNLCQNPNNRTARPSSATAAGRFPIKLALANTALPSRQKALSESVIFDSCSHLKLLVGQHVGAVATQPLVTRAWLR